MWKRVKTTTGSILSFSIRNIITSSLSFLLLSRCRPSTIYYPSTLIIIGDLFQPAITLSRITSFWIFFRIWREFSLIAFAIMPFDKLLHLPAWREAAFRRTGASGRHVSILKARARIYIHASLFRGLFIEELPYGRPPDGEDSIYMRILSRPFCLERFQADLQVRASCSDRPTFQHGEREVARNRAVFRKLPATIVTACKRERKKYRLKRDVRGGDRWSTQWK